MKRRIIIILLLVMCFGCTAKYKITINEDLSVEESITGLEDQNFYDKYYRSSKSRVVNFVMATVEGYLSEEKFKIKEKTEDYMHGANVSKTYKSIKDYYKHSIAYKQYYSDWTIKQKNDIVIISLDNKLPRNSNDPNRYVIDKGTVSIKLPFQVLKHNADKYNKKSHTYTWNVDSTNGDKIYIEFSTKKMASENEDNTIGTIIVIISVAVIFTLIAIFVFKKQKKNNQF